MSSFALLLTLASSVCWSGFDFSRRLLVGRIRPMPLCALVIGGQAPFFLAWGLWTHSLRIEPGFYAPALASSSLNTVANVLFLWSLQVSAFSSVVPMLSFSPVFAALFGYAFLGEALRLLQCAGVALVVAGALTFHFRRSLFHVEKGVWAMIGVALLWSIAIPCDKLAIRHSSPATHATAQSVAVGLATLLITALLGHTGDLARAGRYLRQIALALTFAALALALQFYVFQFAFVGIFETIKRGCGMAMALLLGTLFLKEEVSTKKIVGVGLMATGVAMVVLC